MIDDKDLENIASIPLFGPIWAESIENWLCLADAMRLAGAGLPLPPRVIEEVTAPQQSAAGAITAEAA